MYSRNPDYTNLESILAQIEDLTEGQILRIEDSPSALDKIRHSLYAWLHNNSLKPFFKIKRINRETLIVLRKELPHPKAFVEGLDPKVKEYVVTNLLDCANEESALDTIRLGLPKELWNQALEEWRRAIKGGK